MMEPATEDILVMWERSGPRAKPNAEATEMRGQLMPHVSQAIQDRIMPEVEEMVVGVGRTIEDPVLRVAIGLGLAGWGWALVRCGLWRGC